MSDRHPTVGSVGTAPRPAVPSPESIPPLLPWEHLFPALTPAVQHALLTRAADRGGLTPADLPAPPPTAGDRAAACLTADPAALPDFDPADLADADRHPVEYRAFAAALGCPDLFALLAAAGCDPLARVADLTAEAARRGERVLLVTPTAADADALVAQLAETCGLPVGRAVAPFEHTDRLPATSAARTSHAHGETALADALTKATAAADAAEARLTALRTVAGMLPDLRNAVEELARLARMAGDSVEARVGDAVRQVEEHSAELARLDADAAKLTTELATREAELATLRGHSTDPADHVAKSTSLLAKLKGFLHLDATTKAADLEAKIQAAENVVRDLTVEATRIAARRSAIEEQRNAAEAAVADTPPADTSAVRDRAEVDIRRIGDALAGVGAETVNPWDTVAVDRAAAQLAGFAEKTEAEAAFARGWAGDLAAHGSDLARRFLGLVRVVVGPFAAIGKDALTRSVSDEPGPPFDRLIVTEADQMAEAEFLFVARLAARWILVGDESDDYPRPRSGPRGRPALFRRLLQRARPDPWSLEGATLVARLTSTDGELRSEPLADRPDIELRFGHGPGGDLVVAQVVFPPTTPIAEAKAFLARELGEVRIMPCGLARWTESDDRVTAWWPAAAPAARGGDWADLGDGVREQVVSLGPDVITTAVSFDTAAGWDRASAADWLARHTATSRTAALPRPLQVAVTPLPRLTVGAIG